MIHFLYLEFTKITTIYASLVVTIGHWEELGKFFSKILGVKTWIRRQIKDRRHNVNFIQMLSEGPAILGDVLTAVSKLQGDVPLLLKTIADFQAISADKQDPVKLMADLNLILPDITADLQAIADLLPQPKPAAPPPAA